MWVSREEFLKILRNVRPALGKGDFENAFFFANGRVSAYNGELLISAPLPARFGIRGKLPAKELAALVGKTKTEDIEVAGEPKRLFLGVEEMKARLVKDSEIKLSIYDLAQPAETAWLQLPSDFQEKLRRCLFSASTSKNEPVLSCVRWRGQLLESCDNIRLTRCRLSEAVAEIDVLIPAETAAVLRKDNYHLVAFARTEDWLHLKCQSGITFSCRVYEDDFPPIEDIFALAVGKAFRFPANSIEILNRSIELADKDALSDYFVRVTIDDGIFRVNAEKKTGEIEELTFVNTEENLQFWVNPLYLIEILRRGSDRVAISEKHEGSLERFLKFEGTDFTHLIGVATAGQLTEPACSFEESEDSSARLEPITTYCAGTLTWEFRHERLRNEIDNRLLSFINPRTELDQYLTVAENRQRLKRIMIDSGAFSVWTRGGSIDLAEYTDYCKANIGNVEYVVNLDVIPGSPGDKNLRLMVQEIEDSAAGGYANYRIMLQGGIPKGQLVHVFHQGEQLKWLKKMMEEMDYIGLSPGNDRTTEEKIDWLMECMRYVTDENGRPKVKFHGFAVTSFRLIKLFPWASVDSATWGIVAGMGRVFMPYKRGGKWDFASDVPLHFACSQIKGHPAHVENQPGLVQLTVVDAYLKELGLKRGKSSFDIREKSYKVNKEKNERRVTRKLGIRIGQEISPTVIEELLGGAPVIKDPGPDNKWVETIIEPGVINSVELRQYLNVHYLNEFLKTLPKDRRFIRPKNRVNLRWFLTERCDGPQDNSIDLENRVEKKVQQILSAPPKNLPSPAPSQAKEDRKKKDPSRKVKEVQNKTDTKSQTARHQIKNKTKRKRVDSVKKIVSQYFAAITKVPFSMGTITVQPKPLIVSGLLARGYTCPENCGACCMNFSLDWIPGEAMPEGLSKRPFKFNGQEFEIYSDRQLDNSEDYCKHLDTSNVRCMLHRNPDNPNHPYITDVHPFSCDFEIIRCAIGNEKSDGIENRNEEMIRHNWIGVKKYGRWWNMAKFDGERGALCTIKEPSEESIQDSIRKLQRLNAWADHFQLTETYIPELIEFLETTKGVEGNTTLYPKIWTSNHDRKYQNYLNYLKESRKGSGT